MLDSQPLLASSIAGGPLNIWDKVFVERMDSIDLTPLMVYLIDVVPAEILPQLADQLDVLGYKGWLLATNEAERRSVVKGAIERKKYSGTPWAVKEALISVGYSQAEIVEGIDALYDGVFFYDGTITYGSNHWALFSVENLDLGETKGFDSSDLLLLRNLINEYKRGVTHLVNIGFTANVSDEQLMKGVFEIQLIDLDDEIIEEYAGENLIVDVGRGNLAHALAGVTTGRDVTTIGFGTSDIAPDASDTALVGAFEKAIDGYTFPDSKSVKFDFTLDYLEANGSAIKEFGLICSNASLFARKTRSVINKTDQFKIVGTWTIIFE